MMTDSYHLPSKCCLTCSPHKETEHYVRSTTAEMKMSSEQPRETNPIAKCFLHPRCTCMLSGKSLVLPWQVSRLSGKAALPMPSIPVRWTLAGLALSFSSSFYYKEWPQQASFSCKFMHCFLFFFWIKGIKRWLDPRSWLGPLGKEE